MQTTPAAVRALDPSPPPLPPLPPPPVPAERPAMVGGGEARANIAASVIAAGFFALICGFALAAALGVFDEKCHCGEAGCTVRTHGHDYE